MKYYIPIKNLQIKYYTELSVLKMGHHKRRKAFGQFFAIKVFVNHSNYRIFKLQQLQYIFVRINLSIFLGWTRPK